MKHGEKMIDVEKRKAFLINSAYMIFILGLYYLFMKYAFWLCFPFLFAFFIAVILQKPINYLVRKVRMKKGFASGLCVLTVMCIIVGIFSLIGVRLANEIRELAKYVMNLINDLPNLLHSAETTIIKFIRFLPDSLEKSAGKAITGWFDKIISKDGSAISTGGKAAKNFGFDISMLASPLSGVWSTAKQIPTVIVATIIAIVSCFFMTSDYDRLALFIKRQFPKDKKDALSVSKKIMFSSMKKLLKAYLILMFITFCELVIGLNVLKLIGVFKGDYIVTIAFITAVVDILPVLGTGTVLIPWAAYSIIFVDHGLGFGIGILVIYVIMLILRQAIEPKLVASRLGLPPFITLMGMFIGFKLFGFIGLFLLPLTLILVKLLNDQGIVKLWKVKEDEDPSQAAPVSTGDENDENKEKL